MSTTGRSTGLLNALRALGDSVLALVQERIGLLSFELQEEKLRLIQICIWICAVAFTAVMTLTFVSLVVVYLFWDTARLAVLGGLAGFYAAALVTSIILFRKSLARQGRPFAATVDELREDRACIRNLR